MVVVVVVVVAQGSIMTSVLEMHCLCRAGPQIMHLLAVFMTLRSLAVLVCKCVRCYYVIQLCHYAAPSSLLTSPSHFIIIFLSHHWARSQGPVVSSELVERYRPPLHGRLIRAQHCDPFRSLAFVLTSYSELAQLAQL